jgi:hypothetical protein
MIFSLYRLFHHKVSIVKTSGCVPASGVPEGHQRDTIGTPLNRAKTIDITE